jgi:hypothetical protein
MSTKPTTLPRWANSGGDIVEPASGKKDIGWVDGEEPAAQHANWLLNELYNWAEYLDDGSLQGSLALASDISPTSLAADADDYSPTSLSTAQVIRQDASADVNITGLAGGADGRIMVLTNISAANWITLTDQDANSAAANRFTLPENNPVAIDPDGGTAILLYDATLSRWRLIGGCSLKTYRTQTISMNSGNTTGGTITGSSMVINNGNRGWIGIPVRDGDTLQHVTAQVKLSSGSDTYIMEVTRQANPTGGTTSQASLGTDSFTGVTTIQNAAVLSMAEPVDDSVDCYFVEFYDNTSPGGSCTIYSVAITKLETLF